MIDGCRGVGDAWGGGLGMRGGGAPMRASTSIDVSRARSVFIRVSACRPSEERGSRDADADEMPHDDERLTTHCSGRSSARGTMPALNVVEGNVMITHKVGSD